MTCRISLLLVCAIGVVVPHIASASEYKFEHTDSSGVLVTKGSTDILKVQDLLAKSDKGSKQLLFAEASGAKQYKEVVNQLASLFWSKFYLEQLPKMNRGLFREYSKGALIYKEPVDSNSCTNIKKSKPNNTISGIFFSRKQNENSMSIDVSYRGCFGETVFTESIDIKGSLPTVSDSDILSGSREFSLLPGEEKKTLSYNDKSYFEAFVVHSYRNKKEEIKTSFHSGGHLLAEVTYSPNKVNNKEELVIRPFNLDFQHRFHNINGNHRVKMSFGSLFYLHIDYSKGYPRYFVYSDHQSYLSSRSLFSSYLSVLVEPMINQTAKIFMDDFLLELPSVVTSSSGGGQRFKDDLNLFIVRLRSGVQSDKDLVILQLRNLLKSIDTGEFIYQDNRPSQ